MAVLSGSSANFTPTATADAADLADTTHLAVQGGSTTQRVVFREIMMGGLATVTSPCIMAFARDGQVATGALSGGRSASLDPATAALAAPPVAFTTSATNKARRSATLWLLAGIAFNANGGVVRYNSAPGQEPTLLGSTASFGEASLSAFTGGTVGAMSAHILFEPL